jgi:ATP-dependent Clp protease ATP-binding subunit ClpA
LGHALAKFLFDDPEAMLRLDMSEFMEKHLAARLTGAPAGYVGYDEGGQLTEFVRRHPFSVIMFDEIEKAHPDVFNLLLQIMGSGRLSDAKGKVVNFANTVIIMTSNLGTEIDDSASNLGFVTQSDPAILAKLARKARRKRIDKALKDTFRPEFLGRLKRSIVTFNALGTDEILKIADLELADIIKRASEQKVLLQVTDAARAQLSQECAEGVEGDEEAGEEGEEGEQQVGTLTSKGSGFQFGARPMQGLVEARIEDPLSEQITRGAVKPNDIAVIDYGPLGYTLDIEQPALVLA